MFCACALVLLCEIEFPVLSRLLTAVRLVMNVRRNKGRPGVSDTSSCFHGTYTFCPRDSPDEKL